MISHYDYRLMPEFGGEEIFVDSPYWRVWQIEDNSVESVASIAQKPLFGEENENLTEAQAQQRVEALNAKLDKNRTS